MCVVKRCLTVCCIEASLVISVVYTRQGDGTANMLVCVAKRLLEEGIGSVCVCSYCPYMHQHRSWAGVLMRYTFLRDSLKQARILDHRVSYFGILEIYTFFKVFANRLEIKFWMPYISYRYHPLSIVIFLCVLSCCPLEHHVCAALHCICWLLWRLSSSVSKRRRLRQSVVLTRRRAPTFTGTVRQALAMMSLV